MRRRDFITLLGVTTALSISLGRLGGTATVRRGLKKLGWIEGRENQINTRYANGNVHRMQSHQQVQFIGEFA